MAMKREGYTPSESSRVCSDHFRPEDFDTELHRKIVRLKSSAVPIVIRKQEHGTKGGENYSPHDLKHVQESLMKTESIVLSLSQQLPKSDEEESDIKLAETIMKQLGLSGNTSFDMLAEESQVAVGNRLELILGIVANGALVSLINSILNVSDVEDLVSMKGIFALNSYKCETETLSIMEEPLEVLSSAEEGNSSCEKLETNSILNLGKTLTEQPLGNTASTEPLNSEYEEDLTKTCRVPNSLSLKPTSPSINLSGDHYWYESTENHNDDFITNKMETKFCRQQQISEDTSYKIITTSITTNASCQKSPDVSKRQHLRRKAKEICTDKIINQIHTENDNIEVNEEEKCDKLVEVRAQTTARRNLRPHAQMKECPSCSYRGFEDAIRKHYSRKHQKKDKKTYSEAKRERAAEKDPSSFRFLCKTCNLRYRSYISLWSHKSRKH